MTPQKVLFNTWAGAFFITGGGEVQLLNSKKYLEQAGIEVELYNMWRPQSEAKIFHQFSSVPGVEQVIDGYLSDNKKIVLSPIFWNENLTQEYPLHQHYRSLFNKADLLLTNSEKESELIAQLFDISLDKCHKTRNSITEEYYHRRTDQNFRERFNIDGDFVLTVANIDERKNTKRLVEACESIGISLVSIGNIRHQDQFDLVKDSPIFKHLGPIQDTQLLKSAYQACTIFALPSMCETPGIAALEAASQEAKIVITELGPTSEYFQDYATYVNPWEVKSIEQGILAELNKTRDKSLATYIINNYTWDKTAQDIITGYKKVLQQS